MAFLRKGTLVRPSHSTLRDLMNRSTIAVARTWPPADAYRGRMPLRLHHALNLRHQD